VWALVHLPAILLYHLGLFQDILSLLVFLALFMRLLLQVRTKTVWVRTEKKGGKESTVGNKMAYHVFPTHSGVADLAEDIRDAVHPGHEHAVLNWPKGDIDAAIVDVNL